MEMYIVVVIHDRYTTTESTDGEQIVDVDVELTLDLLDPYSQSNSSSKRYTDALLSLMSCDEARMRRGLLWATNTAADVDSDSTIEDMSSEVSCSEGRTIQNHAFYKQIEKDIPRVALPMSVPKRRSFRQPASISDEKQTNLKDIESFNQSLRHVLHSYAIQYPEIGYVQGMHNVVALMLITGLDERQSFKLLNHIANNVIPRYWHNSSSGNANDSILTDVLVFDFIARRQLPILAHHLESIGVELSHLTLPMFLTIFSCNNMCYEAIALCWDFLLFESSQNVTPSSSDSSVGVSRRNSNGSSTGNEGESETITNNSFMFRLALAMLKASEEDLVKSRDPVACMRQLTQLPMRFRITKNLEDKESLYQLISSTSEFVESCAPATIEMLRRELAPNVVQNSENGDSDQTRGYALYRSMSDNYDAQAMQITMLTELLSVSQEALDEARKKIEDQEKIFGLLNQAITEKDAKISEKDAKISKLKTDCSKLQAELNAREVQVEMLLEQQKQHNLHMITQDTQQASLVRTSSNSPPITPRDISDSRSLEPSSSPSPKVEAKKRSFFGLSRSKKM